MRVRGEFASSGRATGLLSVLLCGLAAPAVGAGVFGSEISEDKLVTIDPSALMGAPVGPYGDRSYNLQGLAGDTRFGGELYGLSAETGRLYSVDMVTGASAAISLALFGGNANGLAYDGISNVLWVSSNAGEVWYYELDYQRATSVGFASEGDLEGLAFDAVTDTLYALSGRGVIFTVDRPSLALTTVADLGPGTWRGLTFDASAGTLVASRVGLSTFVAQVDPLTGQVLTSGDVAGIGRFTQGLAFIPAPGGLAVLALAGLGARRRR